MAPTESRLIERGRRESRLDRVAQAPSEPDDPGWATLSRATKRGVTDQGGRRRGANKNNNNNKRASCLAWNGCNLVGEQGRVFVRAAEVQLAVWLEEIWFEVQL